MHALIENGAIKQYPYGLTQLKKAHKNVSFPKNPSDKVLASFNVLRVFFSTQPKVSNTQVLEEKPPLFDEELQCWVQIWSVRDATQEELSARTSNLASDIREQRHDLLLKCDWTQGKDIPSTVSELWANYRQQLRDITTQEGFPWEVVWPNPPEN